MVSPTGFAAAVAAVEEGLDQHPEKEHHLWVVVVGSLGGMSYLVEAGSAPADLVRAGLVPVLGGLLVGVESVLVCQGKEDLREVLVGTAEEDSLDLDCNHRHLEVAEACRDSVQADLVGIALGAGYSLDQEALEPQSESREIESFQQVQRKSQRYFWPVPIGWYLCLRCSDQLPWLILQH